MADTHEPNYHFKQLTAGAPADALSQLGEALLAVDRLRNKDKVDAAALLRKAWLTLARHLVRNAGGGANPQQQLFLQSGALADKVTLRNQHGDRVEIELLPTEVYETLLACYTQSPRGVPRFVLTPIRRMGAIARADFGPFDLNKPGRYREPVADSGGPQIDLEELAHNLERAKGELEHSHQELTVNFKGFLGSLSNDRLAPVLQGVGGLLQEAQGFIQAAGQPAKLAGLPLPDISGHPAQAAVDTLTNQLATALGHVAGGQLDVLQKMQRLGQIARALTGAQSGQGGAAAVVANAEPPVVLDEAAARVVENDLAAINGVVVQLLNNASNRSLFSPGRVLMAELTDRFENPLEDCYATPQSVAASLRKAEEMHPNCFPHDGAGQPMLPPVYIVPGVDFVKWYDDRFVISFVHTEQARPGAKLRLSSVDLAVMRIYGQFTARGELYDYRGDRVTGNFIADYAGEVKSKAAVKFTGDSKKMTFVTSTEVGDAAGRDEAVEDYIDFIYLTTNGLPVPKRVTARRIGVILEYCTIGDVERTVTLALRYVMSHDPMQVRKIIQRVVGTNVKRTLAVLQQAMASDPQVATRFRRQLDVVAKEVMGNDFFREAMVAGLLSGGPVAAPTAGEEESGGEDDAPVGGHDYFDL
jgi:hypothetical protein